jgi:hypothetical protein
MEAGPVGSSRGFLESDDLPRSWNRSASGLSGEHSGPGHISGSCVRKSGKPGPGHGTFQGKFRAQLDVAQEVVCCRLHGCLADVECPRCCSPCDMCFIVESNKGSTRVRVAECDDAQRSRMRQRSRAGLGCGVCGNFDNEATDFSKFEQIFTVSADRWAHMDSMP